MKNKLLFFVICILICKSILLQAQDSTNYDFVKKHKLENSQILTFALQNEAYHAALYEVNLLLEANPTGALLYLQKGKILRKLGRFEAAIRSYKKAEELGTYYIKDNLGRCYLGLGEFDKALVYFDEALKHNEEDYKYVYRYIGSIHYGRENYPKAIESFNKLLEIEAEQTSGNTYFFLAQAYYAVQKYDDALAVINRGLEKAEIVQLIYFEFKGHLLYEMQQYQKALATYNEAITLYPDSLRLYSKRAVLYRDLDENEKSEADFKKYLERYPEDKEALNNYTALLINMERYSEAEKIALELSIFHSDDANAYVNLGNIARLKNDMKKAEKYLLIAQELEPKHGTASFNLGIAYIQTGRFDEAIVQLKQAIEYSRYPNILHYTNLCIAYQWTRQYQKGLEISNTALEIDPNNGMLYSNKATFYDFMGKRDSAIVFYKRAIDLGFKHMNIVNNLGYKYYQEKQYEEALKYFNQVIEDNTFVHIAYTYNNRANCYLRLDFHTLEPAKLDAEKSLELDPSNSYVYFTLAHIAALEGDKETFYKQLEDAIKLGYPIENSMNEAFLEPFKKEKRFQKLISPE